jgi:hypothetical protein
MAPNPRLQRTRSASPPSPLSRQPLGDRLVIVIALALAYPALAAQPTATPRAETAQAVFLEKPLPDPAEVRKRCRTEPIAAPIVEVELRADGLVGTFKFKRGTGCSAADVLLEESVRRWTFKPALQDGKPVVSWVTIAINHMAGE